MSLRQQWEHEPETPQLLELALIDRYRTASELLAQSEWDGAIYLYGYVAEMVLKTAYFRLQGILPAAPIRGTLKIAKRFVPAIDHEGGHSLLFWSEAALRYRELQNRGLPTMLDLELRRYTQVLYMNWAVDMRYHPDRADRAVATEVAEATAWLFDQRIELGG